MLACFDQVDVGGRLAFEHDHRPIDLLCIAARDRPVGQVPRIAICSLLARSEEDHLASVRTFDQVMRLKVKVPVTLLHSTIPH